MQLLLLLAANVTPVTTFCKCYSCCYLLLDCRLLMVLLPFIAWYLGISLWDAFVLDIALAAFYLVYSYVFNLIYDTLFPLPEWSQKQVESA